MRARSRSAGSRRRCRRRRRASGSSDAASRAPSSTFDDERRAGHAAAGTPAADRRHARKRRGLEMIRRRVTARTRERDELLDRRRRLDELGLRGPAAAHRDDDDASVAREQACDVPCHCGLADALAVPITAIDGSSNGWNVGGSKRKSAPTYGSPSARNARRELQAQLRRQHRLVGQVDDDLRVVRAIARRSARRSPARRAASPSRRSASRRRTRTAAPRARRGRRPIVLAVDDRDRPHRFEVTSPRSAPCTSRRSCLGRELDDALLPVEWVLAPDVDVRPADLDDVVTGPSVPPQPRDDTVPALTTNRSSSRHA